MLHRQELIEHKEYTEGYTSFTTIILLASFKGMLSREPDSSVKEPIHMHNVSSLFPPLMCDHHFSERWTSASLPTLRRSWCNNSLIIGYFCSFMENRFLVQDQRNIFLMANTFYLKAGYLSHLMEGAICNSLWKVVLNGIISPETNTYQKRLDLAISIPNLHSRAVYLSCLQRIM